MNFRVHSKSFAYIISSVFLVSINIWIGLHEDLLTVVVDNERFLTGDYSHVFTRSHNGLVVLITNIPFLLLTKDPIISFYLSSLAIIFCFHKFLDLFFCYYLENKSFLNVISNIICTWCFWYNIGGIYYDHLAVFLGAVVLWGLVDFRDRLSPRIAVLCIGSLVLFFTKATVGSIWICVALIYFCASIRSYGFNQVIREARLGIFGSAVLVVVIALLVDWNVFFDGFIMSPLDFATTQENKSWYRPFIAIFWPWIFDFGALISDRFHPGLWVFFICVILPYYAALGLIFWVIMLRGVSEASNGDRGLPSLVIVLLLVGSISSGAVVGRLYSEVAFFVPVGVLLVISALSKRKEPYFIVMLLLGVFVGTAVANDFIKRNKESAGLREGVFYVSSIQLPWVNIYDMKLIAEFVREHYSSDMKISFVDDNGRALIGILPEYDVISSHLTYAYGLAVPLKSPSDFSINFGQHLNQTQSQVVISTLPCTERRFRISASSDDHSLKALADSVLKSLPAELRKVGFIKEFTSPSGCEVWRHD